MNPAMNSVLVLASFFLVAQGLPFETLFLKEWNLFKATYNKLYDTPVEDYYRMQIFRNNKYFIAHHNLKYVAGEVDFEVGVNEFSDMLPEEVDEIYNGFNKENRLRTRKGEEPYLPELDGEMFEPSPNLTAPTSINWVEKGAVTPVLHQGKCGACYAFAAVGALEGHQYINSKKLVSLSMQNIVDCSQSFGNKGCNGGLAMYSFNYIKSNRGINDYSSYPYEGKEGKCRFNPNKIAGKCSGYVQVASGNEEMLKSAVAVGPVAVSIDSSLKSFQSYKGGIYSDAQCSSTKLGHAVLVVGYGTDATSKKDYWLVKNSWGKDWGDKGYVKIARNAKNMCGIATRAVYPKV